MHVAISWCLSSWKCTGKRPSGFLKAFDRADTVDLVRGNLPDRCGIG